MSEEEEKVETQETETMSVDLWETQIELPTEIAKQVIAIRDNKTKEYNQVNEQLKSVKSAEEQAKLAKVEAERKAEALEAAKNNDIEKAKELLSTEYRDKISRYESHSYRMAVENAVRKVDGLIEGAAADVISSVMGSNKFQLGEDMSVKTDDGRNIDEVVTQFVDARPYLKIAKGNKPMGTPRTGDKPDTEDVDTKFRKGLEKLLG